MDKEAHEGKVTGAYESLNTFLSGSFALNG